MANEAEIKANLAAITAFNGSILTILNRQTTSIFEKTANRIRRNLKKGLDQLYKEFTQDILRAIGGDGPTKAVIGGGVSSWERLSQGHQDKKTIFGGGDPDFFLFKGRLRQYFTDEFNPRRVFGAPKVGIRDSKKRDSRIEPTGFGSFRIKKGKTVGSQKAGQFVKDIRDLLFIITPVIFPRIRQKSIGADFKGNRNSIIRLFPKDIGWRLWNKGRPFRPLVGPIINYYGTVKLNAVIAKAKKL